MAENAWTVRLSATADADFRQILRWTVDNFGPVQAKAYAATLSSAMKALCDGPSIIDAKARPEIDASVWTLHVACNGRKGRHFILFRVADTEDCKAIDVLRFLHDSMDLERHLPPQS